MADRVQTLVDHALDLGWSLWGQLGVSTWSASHRDWAIELEPLTVFTGFIAKHDRRLLRESVDWCVANDKYVSMTQLRHVLTDQTWPFEGPFGRYAATVSRHTKRTWPGSQGQSPYEIAPSGKSRLGDLREPSLVQLRLRSLFGVNARAEIVRVLLTDPYREWSTAEIAQRVCYTRRQTNNDLEALTLGGLTRRAELAGSFVYAPLRPDTLLQVLGEQPKVAPRWAPVFRVMTGLLDAAVDIASRDLSKPAMELARRLRWLEGPLQAIRAQPPRPTSEDTYVAEVLDWTRDLFAGLARGDPGGPATAWL